MERRPAVLGTALCIAAIIGIITVNTTTYEPFRLVESEQEGQYCEQHQAQCICVGSLAMNATYPPGYACDGYSICRDINRTVCPAGP